ncbi:MAG: hypothetical protein ACTHQQ_19295, partial [Solirubrobacteraceae bacterium]
MRSVTTTVHSAADALGNAAMANTHSVTIRLTAPTMSSRPQIGDAILLPRLALGNFLLSSVVPASLDAFG